MTDDDVIRHRRVALDNVGGDDVDHLVRLSWHKLGRTIGVDDVRVVVAEAGELRRSLVAVVAATPEMDLRGVATTLEGGVRAATDGEAEVVVLGSLPGTTPADACRAVRSAVPGVRVLVVSGDASPEAVAAAFEAGALGFLPHDGLDDRAVERAVLTVGADLRFEPAYDHPA